jgi:hypothetical protein
MLRLDRTGRAHLIETRSLGRLARQLRQDVHAARKATPAEGGDPSKTLELLLPGDTIVAYEARERGLVRSEKHGASLDRRESYTLPSCSDPRFLVQTNEAQTWIHLRLPRGPMRGEGGGSLHQSLEIDALLGRDHRFAERQEAAR